MTKQIFSGRITFRQNHPSASHFAFSYTFLCSVVCLSVVCHIRAPCLNRLTDLDAIWQVHLRGPMTHCVTWWSLASWEGEIWAETAQPKHATANSCCYLENRKEEIPPIVMML